MFGGARIWAITPGGTGGATAGDVIAWDQLLNKVPAGAATVALGDQIVPLAVAKSWRDQLAARAAGQPSGNLSSQSGITKWPGGNVPYAFTGTVTVNHQALFSSAVKDWEMAASVHFILRTSETDYIAVNNQEGLRGGNSSVGKTGGAQALNLGTVTNDTLNGGVTTNSWNRATILHEVGHALGLIHEHQRNDRDTFVTIAAAFQSDGNFVKIPTSTNQTVYDFLSVMHYARNAFSTNGSDTITPLAAYASFGGLMGAQFNPVLSRRDRQGMAILYGASATAPSLVVTNSAESGSGSLRAALVAASDMADDTPGLHPAIRFQIPTTDANYAGGTFAIKLRSSLQPQNNTVVDGDTEGNNNANGPEIRLTRAAADPADATAPGVQMTAAGSEWRHFAIDSFFIAGMEITGSGATANTVAGCYIGTTPQGTAAAANVNEGVLIRGGASGNIIGGTTLAARNLISGNGGNGVGLSGSGTAGNVVAGNYIGVNASGTGAVPNGQAGVAIQSSASGNTVGGTAGGAGNLLSGNGTRGVAIIGPTDGNFILGNWIGTNATGTSAMPNIQQGVIVFNAATNTTIGGAIAGAGNVISGNKQQGISILGTGTTGTKVAGNYIGVDSGGLTALGNGTVASKFPGISIFSGAQQTVIGGTTPAERNVISGNTLYGIGISDAGTSLNTVSANYIGLGADGAMVLPNTTAGVIVYNSASGNTVGGLVPDAGNVISGNNGYGVNLQGGATGNSILGNFVGLNAAGLLARPNTFGGVALFGGAPGNTIGAPGEGRNYLAGNSGFGLDLDADGNFVKGNTIGLNVAGGTVGNTAQGIVINGKNNAIGGSGVGEANRISGNGGSGIVVYNNISTGNTIMGNSIYGNASQALDLWEGNGSPYTSGPTANDTGDGDSGPNNLQNFPALASAVLTTVTTVSGTLNSTASGTFRLEFFASPSGGQVGEMRTYIGSTSVATNASGNGSFSTPLPATVVPGYIVTATATDAAGNTSEAAPGVPVTVDDLDGDGLPKAWETANGLSTSQNDAALDPDGDGMSNLSEFYAGTNPKNGLSRLQATLVEKLGSDFRITVPTASGRTYQLEYNDDLSVLTGWRTLADQVLATGGNLQITDAGAFAHASRYYRLKLAQ